MALLVVHKKQQSCFLMAFSVRKCLEKAKTLKHKYWGIYYEISYDDFPIYRNTNLNNFSTQFIKNVKNEKYTDHFTAWKNFIIKKFCDTRYLQSQLENEPLDIEFNQVCMKKQNIKQKSK